MIIGICNGSRASAMIRIGHGLSHHNRTMFTLPGKTAMNSAAAASAASRRVRSHQQQTADSDLGHTGRVGVEARASGQLGGNDSVERFRRQKVQGADAEEQRCDAVCAGLAGVALRTGCDGGHGYIVSCAGSSR